MYKSQVHALVINSMPNQQTTVTTRNTLVVGGPGSIAIGCWRSRGEPSSFNLEYASRLN